MPTSQRLRSTPEGIRLVAKVAAYLAEAGDGRTSVLAVSTYLPVDVDSVARVFDGLEEVEGIEQVEEGPLTLYEIGDRERFLEDPDYLQEHQYLKEVPGFMRVVGAMKSDPRWVQKVREQHQVLHLLAGAEGQTVELRYLTSRSTMSRAKIQSLLNDFDAAGYVGVEFDEDVEKLRYHLPVFDYSQQRLDRNMEFVEEAEVPARSRSTFWVFLAVIAVVILMLILVLGF